MPTLERSDTTLVYDDSEESDLLPVVFLHGLSMSREDWEQITPALAGRFRVLSLDQRGHGMSSHPGGYVLDNYVADAIELLERVVRQPAVLVGHSLGGVVAFAVAQRRPELVRGIFLEDPPLYVLEREPAGPGQGVGQFFPMMQQLCRDMQSRNAPLEEYEALIGNFPSMNGAGTMKDALGPDGVRAMAHSFKSLDPEVYTPAIDGAAISGVDLGATVPSPTLIVRADPTLGAAFSPDDEKRYLDTSPHAAVEVFDGASHGIHGEQRERFVKVLELFLEQVA